MEQHKTIRFLLDHLLILENFTDVSPVFIANWVNPFYVKSVSNPGNKSADHLISQRGKCCCVIAVCEWSLCPWVKMCIRSHYRWTLCLLNSEWPHTLSFLNTLQPKGRQDGEAESETNRWSEQTVNELKRFSNRKVSMWSVYCGLGNKKLSPKASPVNHRRCSQLFPFLNQAIRKYQQLVQFVFDPFSPAQYRSMGL